MWNRIMAAPVIGRMTFTLPLAVAARTAFTAPVDVQIWGRNFRVDPLPGAEDMDQRPLSTLLRALPSDLASAPGFQPTDEQILAEVEERAWIAQFQGEDALRALMRKNPRADEFELGAKFYEGRGGATSPETQRLFDTHAALKLLTRGLRSSMGKPEEANAGFHFTLPQLPAEVVASYRRQGFNPAAAYAGFRTVKAAYRARDLSLIARVVDFPLTMGGSRRRTIRNADGLAAARDAVLHPGVREVVTRQAFNDLFVRDQGAMFGNGEVWIGPGLIGNMLFQVKTINVKTINAP
ncbi:hypothetical protein [Roseomonas xinghualingensis]|uniref:hypothetical protein n=1 Tax=Roseomonas xinghualingensis TaxID=2986475 RepID=UPI0021F0F5C6|nr:hypothetical protein [Roseomonas sp. SXEYE001]MCV4207166.1 hypothetical protein [Roseomonas sp. SXEYE001]